MSLWLLKMLKRKLRCKLFVDLSVEICLFLDYVKVAVLLILMLRCMPRKMWFHRLDSWQNQTPDISRHQYDKIFALKCSRYQNLTLASYATPTANYRPCITLLRRRVAGGSPSSNLCTTKGSTAANSPLLGMGVWGKAPLMSRHPGGIHEPLTPMTWSKPFWPSSLA